MAQVPHPARAAGAGGRAGLAARSPGGCRGGCGRELPGASAAPGTVMLARHLGHFTTLPAAVPGALSLAPHVGQAIAIDMGYPHTSGAELAGLPITHRPAYDR